jgi:hypothetical protein
MSETILFNLLATVMWLFLAGCFWGIPYGDRFNYKDGRKWGIRAYSWSAMVVCILCAIATWY